MNYELALWVFMLAAFLGFELIRRVSPLLHTPLMRSPMRYRPSRLWAPF
jgi:NAD/NADP transhydrogenase alpha subunit